MQIIVVSINHHTTPIEIREKLTFQQEELVEAMQILQKQPGIMENVLLSTCNRTEIYAVVEQATKGLQSIKQFMMNWFSLSLETIDNHLVSYKDDKAVAHLFRVSAGVDSMVIGETQILGQVRESFLRAQSFGMTKTIFNQLFKEAITFSKKVHAKTSIGEKTVSISYAAVQLLKQVAGRDLDTQSILILGAGEMGELTLKNLQAIGVKNITLLSRTLSTAEKLAQRYGVMVKSIEELTNELLHAGGVISGTSGTEPIIQYDMMHSVMKARKRKPCYLIDIAVPRDIDAQVAEIPATHLYDIDDIQKIVDANLAARQKVAQKIEVSIAGQVTQFNKWLATLQVVPVITALQKQGEQIQQRILESLFNKMPELTTREKKVLHNHTQSIVNQFLREPIRGMKEIALAEDGDEELRVVEKLFGLEDIERGREAELATLAKERLKDQL